MAEIIRMPKMSDTMTEGTIAAWHKQVGDKVKSGDIIAEVETDKATMELDNYVDGVLLHIGIQAGESIPVDGVIAIIGKEGEDISALLSGGSAPVATATPVAQVASEAQVAVGRCGGCGRCFGSGGTRRVDADVSDLAIDRGV